MKMIRMFHSVHGIETKSFWLLVAQERRVFVYTDYNIGLTNNPLIYR